MNKVELIGRLTKNPELRVTQQGLNVATGTVAINSRYGEKEQVDFINIIAWGNLGKFLSTYYTKGMPIAVVGRLKNNNYEDSKGNKRYTTEVIAETIEFIGSKKQEVKDDPVETQPQNNIPETKEEFENMVTLDDDFLPF